MLIQLKNQTPSTLNEELKKLRKQYLDVHIVSATAMINSNFGENDYVLWIALIDVNRKKVPEEDKRIECTCGGQHFNLQYGLGDEALLVCGECGFKVSMGFSYEEITKNLVKGGFIRGGGIITD